MAAKNHEINYMISVRLGKFATEFLLLFYITTEFTWNIEWSDEAL
jgi:hypothetical protein